MSWLLTDSNVREIQRRSGSKLWHLSKLSGTLSPIPCVSFYSVAPSRYANGRFVSVECCDRQIGRDRLRDAGDPSNFKYEAQNRLVKDNS